MPASTAAPESLAAAAASTAAMVPVALASASAAAEEDAVGRNVMTKNYQCFRSDAGVIYLGVVAERKYFHMNDIRMTFS